MSQKTPILGGTRNEHIPRKTHFQCGRYSCVQNLPKTPINSTLYDFAKHYLKNIKYTDTHLKLWRML